jgi:hypothetical protein
VIDKLTPCFFTAVFGASNVIGFITGRKDILAVVECPKARFGSLLFVRPIDSARGDGVGN